MILPFSLPLLNFHSQKLKKACAHCWSLCYSSTCRGRMSRQTFKLSSWKMDRPRTPNCARTEWSYHRFFFSCAPHPRISCQSKYCNKKECHTSLFNDSIGNIFSKTYMWRGPGPGTGVIGRQSMILSILYNFLHVSFTLSTLALLVMIEDLFTCKCFRRPKGPGWWMSTRCHSQGRGSLHHLRSITATIGSKCLS